MILVRYDSNNSGGYWWLTDKDWSNLAAAGWTVAWSTNRCKHCNAPSETQHNEWMNYEEFRKRRGEHPYTPAGDSYMGALATNASKEFPSLQEGIEEWERITSEDATDKGCSCCGTPHNFIGTDTETGEQSYNHE